MSQSCQVCGPDPQQCPTVLCASCALIPVADPIDSLIAPSSVGAGLADIKKRGITAHLDSLDLEMR